MIFVFLVLSQFVSSTQQC